MQAKRDGRAFASLRSLDPDPNAVTHIPGDWLRSDIPERCLGQAIKTDLLFGDGFQLELMAVGIGQDHLKKACRISLLDMMKHDLAGKAEVSTLAHLQTFGSFGKINLCQISPFEGALHEPESRCPTYGQG